MKVSALVFTLFWISQIGISQDHFVDPANICGGSTPCYTSIQAAINAASPSQTILVSPGTYNENLDINKALTIISSGGKGVTTIIGTIIMVIGRIAIRTILLNPYKA